MTATMLRRRPPPATTLPALDTTPPVRATTLPVRVTMPRVRAMALPVTMRQVMAAESTEKSYLLINTFHIIASIFLL
jgi:hypothetical protein